MDDLVKDKLESEEEIQNEQIEKESKVKSIFDLWFKIQEHSALADTSLMQCRAMIRCIAFGALMLPDSERELKKEARDFLNERKQYLEQRNIEHERSSGFESYRFTANSAGVIRTAPTEFDKGLTDLIEQNANHILPQLMEMDSKISEKLIEHEIVPIRNYTPLEFYTQKTLQYLWKRQKDKIKNNDVDHKEESREDTDANR
ncbi:MAG TPA: hypothetical protein VMY59_08265 [Candidatus Thermoplasmatota archaeon]|nr:hypothetical protein [Candidatus Thermoplasmatota archaeon]